jgi:hypothetical protein
MQMNSASRNAQKILAFFGSGPHGKGPELLQRAYDQGYALLALDTAAASLAVEAKVPYTLIDNWIDSEATSQATEEAAECERKWFEAARDEFTLDGICWPDFDRHAMSWFWRNVTLAGAFAQAFRTRGAHDLRFCGHPVRRPGVYYSSSDVCSAFWEADLADSARAFEKPPKLFWYRFLYYARAGVRKMIARAKSRGRRILKDRECTDPSLLSGKIVLAFNPGEFHRFTHVIEQLSESLPGKLAAVVLSRDPTTETRIATQWSIPVGCLPLHAPIDVNVQKQFLSGYVQALCAAGNLPWQKALNFLRFHFEYYCKQRWPKLVADFRSWCRLWDEARPDAVVVSSLYDGESQLPSEAAKRLGIPTLSIPHGGVIAPDNLLSTDYILYTYPIQKTILEHCGIRAHRLIACRNLVPENEYPTSSSQPVSKQGWRLLVLTDPCGFAGNFAPTISIRDQITGLQALDHPPEDIAERLSLNIKVHPGYPDQEVFAVVGDRIRQKVLPVNSELPAALEQTDLVVALNYYGSALIHALRSGKAIIFFCTTRQGSVLADLFHPAGLVVRKPEEFWSIVRNFFTDSTFAEQMSSKAQEFCAKNLHDSDYPNIGEVMNRILSEENTGSSRFNDWKNTQINGCSL